MSSVPKMHAALLPPCMQLWAPAEYELRNEKGHKLSPNFVGYPVYPNRSYTISVKTQQGYSKGWKIELAPPQEIEVLYDEREEKEGLQIGFRLQRYVGMGDFFRKPTIDLPMAIRFEDRRLPYKFYIPIVLQNRHVALILSMLGGLFSLSFAIYRYWAPGSEFNIILFLMICADSIASAAISVFLLYSGYDLLRSYLTIQQFLQALNKRPSVPNAETIAALEEGEHPEQMLTSTLEKFKQSLDLQ